jgi:hypothetical protein
MRRHIRSKAKYEMRSVALFRWHSQPLAVVHFRGALTGFFQFFSKYSFAFKAFEISVFGWFLDLYKEL